MMLHDIRGVESCNSESFDQNWSAGFESDLPPIGQRFEYFKLGLCHIVPSIITQYQKLRDKRCHNMISKLYNIMHLCCLA